MREIGERLFEERRRLNLSQTEMGKLGGVSLNTYHMYEKGTRYPDAECLANLYSAGVDALFVVTGVRNSSVMSNEESVLLAEFNKLDPKGRTAWLSMMQVYNNTMN